MTAWLIFIAGLLQMPVLPPETPLQVGTSEGGSVVTAPKILRKVEPKYSSEALRAQIQGTVVYKIVVGKDGRPFRIEVLSPIGFGLDEAGQAAIEQWRFEPGTKGGEPVSVLATVEVNFRLQGRSFDEKAERRRITFNANLANLRSQEPKRVAGALKELRSLADQDYGPAVGVLGRVLFYGEGVPKDPVAGFALIQKAAKEDYGPALYQVGLAYVTGSPLPKDTEQGLKMMRNAATLGSPQAQFYLGALCEKGDTVPMDLDRARRYYRLCGTAGVDLCQLHMGILLRDKDPIQALAWFHLAKVQNNADATKLADTLQVSLTQEQIGKADRMQAQLVRKR